MFVAAANEESNLNSLGAATFVSVVSILLKMHIVKYNKICLTCFVYAANAVLFFFCFVLLIPLHLSPVPPFVH